MRRKAIAAGLTTALVLVVSLAIRSGGWEKQEELAPEVVSGPTATALQAYPVARARAKKWRPNAYLEEVFMIIAGNAAPLTPQTITYSFIADHQVGPVKWWDSVFITIDTQTGKIIQFDEYRFATDNQRWGPFHIETALLDSSDALRLAEALGGKAYREKYPNAQIRIDGTHGATPDGVVWGVGYFRPPDRTGDELSFGVDARTGETNGPIWAAR